MGFVSPRPGSTPASCMPPALLEGASENGSIDAHAVQPYYAGLLARACGLRVSLTADGDAIIVATV